MMGQIVTANRKQKARSHETLQQQTLNAARRQNRFSPPHAAEERWTRENKAFSVRDEEGF